MAEKIGLEIDVQIAQAAKNVGELRKAFDDAKKKAIEIGKAFGENSVEFKKAEQALSGMVTQFGAFGKVKTDLRESKEILTGIIQAYGATSKEAIAAAKAAAGFADEIDDAGNLIKAFNPDAKFQAFSGALQSTVGGFAALQGAMGLFGGESKELEKVLLKVQSAMALSQGINSIIAAKESFTVLATVVRTQVVTAFATLKGALLATGLGALVVGIGLAIKYFHDLSAAADAATESQKRALEERTRLADVGLNAATKFLDQQKKLDVARAKSTGKSEEDIFKIEQNYRNIKLQQLKKYHQDVKGDKTKALEAEGQIADLEVEIEEAKLNRIADARKKSGGNKTNKPAAAAKVDPRLEEAKRLNEQLIEENDKYRLTEEERSVKHFQKLRDILIAGKQNTLQADIAQNRAQADLRGQDLQTNLNTESQQRIDAALNLANTLIPLHTGIQVNQTELERQQSEARKLIAEQEKEHKRDVLNAIGGLVSAASDLLGQQTVAGKAFAIASTLISTYDAAQKAYASQFVALNPTSPILANLAAATAIISGLARVKAIASVKVPGKGSGGSFAGGSLQTSSGFSGGQISPALQSNTTILDKKSIDDLANQALKAFVVESDISNSQARIQRIKKSAIFG